MPSFVVSYIVVNHTAVDNPACALQFRLRTTLLPVHCNSACTILPTPLQ